ncbi:copper transporter [Brachybacterium sp. MASK1Z-5]|uniref:Copper transporter n=1 Tax=Brachybacterium halotolerans TaxID=2795215 RepID=A0ABS1B716_9MICO|nr:copper transporter [Brachybacterium halotolerans]
MIDFRYHLVSLISVFLALAVGIVLGAGPLRENLGSQLTGQVEQLRTEKDDLRTANDSLTSQNDELSAFISQTSPDLVAGTLSGRSTAVVSDDDSVRNQVSTLDSLLDEAGASTPLSVRLDSSLWDPDQEDTRTKALDSLRDADGALVAAAESDTDSSSGALSTIIGHLLVDTSIGAEQRQKLWSVLTDARLVDVDGSTDAPVDSMIFASAAPSDLTVSGDDASAAAERAQLLLEAQTGLLERMVSAKIPTVVSGSTPSNDDSAGLLRTVRGDSRFGDLSSGDRLQEPDGPTIAVLALAEQARGEQGSYGTAADAQDRVPQVPGGSGGGSGDSSGSGSGSGSGASDGGEG